MLGVLADHHDAAFALDDLALLADGLNRGAYLHARILLTCAAAAAAGISSCCAT